MNKHNLVSKEDHVGMGNVNVRDHLLVFSNQSDTGSVEKIILVRKCNLGGLIISLTLKKV